MLLVLVPIFVDAMRCQIVFACLGDAGSPLLSDIWQQRKVNKIRTVVKIH